MREQARGAYLAKALDTVALAVSILLLSGPLTRAQNYTNFTIELGTSGVIPDASGGIPVYPWFPDGHISFLPDGNSFQMYWAGSSSYRSMGTTIESQVRNPPTGSALTKGASTNDFDNGGAWLMSVFRQDGDNLIGFYHGEDHHWPGYSNPGNIAWKSIAYCSSTDNGITWTKGGQMITSPTAKPASPTWGGSGDACVVYDAKNARWVAFYQEHWIYTAISTNPIPLPGTWRKYHNGSYSQPGLGGLQTRVPGLTGHAGANPSVHFNTHLKKWVMVWHTWNSLPNTPTVWLSTSDDLLHWQPPVKIVSVTEAGKAWYPTIIGQTDVLASEYANLYYAYWPDKSHWQRQFIGVPIRFHLEDTDLDELPDEWERHHFGSLLHTFEGDWDGDGCNNGNEYLADTVPTNSASCFRIEGVFSRSANETVLSWQSSEYKYYRIEESTNQLTSWAVLSSNIPSTPPLNSFTNTSGHPGAFYRIRLEQD
jgi:hypothetical protein